MSVIPGYICPFCLTDASPISGSPACVHFFLVDGENGWRFTAVAQALYDASRTKSPTLFRDLLYHDPACREHLRLLRATYEDSLEIFVWSSDPEATVAAFRAAIERN